MTGQGTIPKSNAGEAMNVQTTIQGQEDNPQDPVVPTDPGPIEVVAETPAPEAPTEVPSNGTSKPNGQVVELKQSAFKRIKQEARQRGFKKAEQEILARFAKRGCNSFEDVEKLLDAKPQQKPVKAEKEDRSMAKPEETAKPRQRTKPDARDRKIAKLEAEKARDTRKWRTERDRRKSLESQLQAKDAEIALREIAVRKGVKDVDYALRLLVRENKGKSEEECAQFNEGEFFDGLRDKSPYLFGEIEVPATTGTAGAENPDAPTPPTADQVSTQVAAGDQFDARTATREEVERRLQDMGATPP
jgi:hypothetical protein